jgi:hypothetical protein
MTPGRVLMDLPSGCPFEMQFSFLLPDGTPIGTIAAVGINSNIPPPGAPSVAKGGMGVVVGGSGVFLGVRGQTGMTGGSSRMTSITEDPAYRRANGGGQLNWFVQIIPSTWPEVLALPLGPAIYHGSDFSPVTAANPARAGETLIAAVAGLGPVKPNLDPGKPFPSTQEGKFLEVNSPVEATVGGKSAVVINKFGWPEMTNVYRVDFRVPEGTPAGMATLQISVAWIAGPEVKFRVQ